MESENTAIWVAEELASACQGNSCPLAERVNACPLTAPCGEVTAEDWLIIFRQAPSAIPENDA